MHHEYGAGQWIIPQCPRKFGLEVNEIDDFVRRHGRSTLALGLRTVQKEKSKHSGDVNQNIEQLSRTNGELRMEVTFYRECFAIANQFKDKIDMYSQELLFESVIGLVAASDEERLWDISRGIRKELEVYLKHQSRAFDAFAALYRVEESDILPQT